MYHSCCEILLLLVLVLIVALVLALVLVLVIIVLPLMLTHFFLSQDDGDRVRVQYYSELDDGIMNNDSFMCRWLMKTENAVMRGSRQEVYKHGMVEAVFSPNNKLLRVELAFDVMSFMQQLRRASGLYDFKVSCDETRMRLFNSVSFLNMQMHILFSHLTM